MLSSNGAVVDGQENARSVKFSFDVSVNQRKKA